MRLSQSGIRVNRRPYQVLLGYATRYWRTWLCILILTLFSTGIGLLAPWPMKILVDNVLGHAPPDGLISKLFIVLPGATSTSGFVAWVALATLVVFAVNSTVDVVLTMVWVKVGQSLVYDLASDVFRHIQRRSLLFHTRSSVGDLMSRIMGDSWCVHTLVENVLFTPGHALITIIGVSYVMFRLDPRLALLALAAAPCMAVASVLMGRRIRSSSRQRREIEARIEAHVHQTLSGISVIQAFAREDAEHQRFREFAAAAIYAQKRSSLIGSFSGLTTGLSSTIGSGVVLWVAAQHVLAGRLTVGEVLVFLSYLGTMQTQMIALTGIYSTLQGAAASVHRVWEVLSVDREVEDRPGAVVLPPVQGHVRLEGVTFGYEPGRPVLRGMSLEVLPGQTIAVVGATGAGKSTLVSLVPRFFDPWEGRVLVDGRDVRDVQIRSLREQVSLVLQEPFLFPVSVADNIAYGRPEASRGEIETAARAANAHLFIERLPEGYDTVLGERGATLSGGERQRLSIARALLKDAPILILDEPTSALDVETEALLLEALGRLMARRTTLIIAHRLSTIRSADVIAVLQDGAIAEQGSHAELLTRGGLYAGMVHGGPRASGPPVAPLTEERSSMEEATA